MRTRTRRQIILWTIIPALVTVVIAVMLPAAEAGAQVVTPYKVYSGKDWQKKAKKYQSKLSGLERRLSGRFGSRFELLRMGESSVGGIGFWSEPGGYGDDRYLCVFARVQLPRNSPFPNTKSGRVLSAMDGYGKECIYAIASALRSIDDSSVRGGAVILIYGPDRPGDPGFESNAEAMGLFIPRDAVMRFADLQMTIQSLFSSSYQLPVMQGSQISSLRKHMFQP